MPDDLFEGFVTFEQEAFGKDYPIANYDPHMIRYGEYQFLLETLDFKPGQTVLDVGCEYNIMLLYLATRGGRLLGVDLNPAVAKTIQERRKRVERALGRRLEVRFQAEDATRLSLEAESVDRVVAISSIEHMFSDQGHGDVLAVASIARVLKPGGVAVITVPASNGGPFHEQPRGDARFAGPYRLYTPEKLRDRFMSNPDLETVRFEYLSQTTPDPRFNRLHFYRFWSDELKPRDRAKWAWATPILGRVFNPITPAEEAESHPESLNTALIALRKK
jgi:SAM-dependent methyltransferase